MRPIVGDALAAGIRPAIYGGGWRGLVDPSLVVADHVDNDELPAVYRSAGVVLNDHWDTMRAWGFVSNRLFDVLACGTPVISDHLPEIEVLFGDAVPTYSSDRRARRPGAGGAGRRGRRRERWRRAAAPPCSHSTRSITGRASFSASFERVGPRRHACLNSGPGPQVLYLDGCCAGSAVRHVVRSVWSLSVVQMIWAIRAGRDGQTKRGDPQQMTDGPQSTGGDEDFDTLGAAPTLPASEHSRGRAEGESRGGVDCRRCAAEPEDGHRARRHHRARRSSPLLPVDR